jgi:3-hydroxybutyryl-CoA dehydrogenase
MNGRSPPETIAAIGAGRMGRGIAVVFAYAGHPVILVDLKPRDVALAARLESEAREEIAGHLDALARGGLIAPAELPAILARIRFVGRPGAAAALADADFIFEGVPEVIEAKREALDFTAASAKPDAIIASTTSSFLVDTLAEAVAGPERFLNAHWLNPAFLIPLVELCPGKQTSAATVQRLKSVLERIGKVPVVCAAIPGYIVPRIQSLAMNEAARMVEEGLASAEDIDKATRYGLGFRFAILGVLEFIDWGGGDILYYASRYLADALGDSRYAAPAIIDHNMQDGRIGLGTGQGFYDYSGTDIAAYRQDRLGRLVGLLRHLGLARPPGRAIDRQ